MVRLTMTEAIVAALNFCSEHKVEGWPAEKIEGEPSLQEPAIGKPIPHGQLIDLSKSLQKHLEAGHDNAAVIHDLNGLLRGSQVYIEPPKPKPEPTSEYKELMARLRKEDEARSYERMVNPSLPSQTFNHRYPNAPTYLHASATAGPAEDDEVTYADINRQMAVIINVLLSIVACSAAIWMAAKSWSIPARLGLSMSGSTVVAIAEVVIYAGYLRRVKEAKTRSKKQKEVKEIMSTWVIDGKPKDDQVPTALIISEEKREEDQVRRRPQKKKI